MDNEEDIKIAKNLLLNKTCDNCLYLHGSTMTCEINVELFSNTLLPLPDVNTCVNWKYGFNSILENSINVV